MPRFESNADTLADIDIDLAGFDDDDDPDDEQDSVASVTGSQTMPVAASMQPLSSPQQAASDLPMHRRWMIQADGGAISEHKFEEQKAELAAARKSVSRAASSVDAHSEADIAFGQYAYLYRGVP
jgi:hypothetical protein